MEKVRKLVLEMLADEDVAIALFGSAANGTTTQASDIEVAIIPKGIVRRWKVAELREAGEELAIPFMVDIVDFLMVSDSFKEVALQSAIWWKK